MINPFTSALKVPIRLLIFAAIASPNAQSLSSYCKTQPQEQLQLDGLKVQRIESVQPHYAGFNIFEGPVWVDDALYFSNIGSRSEGGKMLTSQSVVRRWRPGQSSDTVLDDSLAGVNGLALGPRGSLLAGRQLDGSIVRISLNDKSLHTLTGEYEDKRFNSPNDLVLSQSGDIYFTDPNWNVPSNVDPASTQGGGKPGELTPGQRVYRLSPDGVVSALSITEQVKALRDKPNGITLSLDEKQLVVGGLQGLWVFDISSGQARNARQIQDQQVDGLGRDCAGNIYVATLRNLDPQKQIHGVAVYSPQWQELGFIRVHGAQLVTNVAFGGADNSTLFITTLGSSDAAKDGPQCDGQPCNPASLYQVKLNLPGLPY